MKKKDWKNITDQAPIEGVEIWVLTGHYKAHWPSSYQICGGEVEYSDKGEWRVNTNDYDGSGSHCFYPSDVGYKGFDAEKFTFWCYKQEIEIPECLKK